MNTPSKERVKPVAYFITFTCYGTWLHGNKIMSVDRNHNIPGTEFLSFNTVRQHDEKKRMPETPYLLDKTRRHIALCAIQETCIRRAWHLLAAHVRTNHVHLVVNACELPEKMMDAIKSAISHCLNVSMIDNHRINRWTRHGSTRYLWNDVAVEATIQYVVHEQGLPMAVFENKNRHVFY